ncbi:MAG: protoporphyrinogen/coproporphyrinogen oxidase, partial [Solirubrobacteraceae bacterium]|nr:protoporphyrinogen/coproporphyrinogen oxidase [Solirubrobacteraceae bacterium]
MDRMVRSGVTTRLLSPRAKLRVARLAFDVLAAKLRGRLDYDDMRKSAPLATESARDYALRALSAETDAYLCEPIVRTMLIADTNKVSKVELLSGIANIFTADILALVGGQGALPETLAERLDVQLNRPVEEVRRTPDGVTVDGQAYDGAVVACPLPAAAAMCPDHAALLGPLAARLDYTQAITVAIGTTRPPDCPAFLVQFPSREDPDIALLFLDHNKAPDRAPAGHGLLGACWETDAAARMLDASDEQIVTHTLQTVFAVWPELHGTVDFTDVTRWPAALPFTGIGAYQEIGRFNAALDRTDSVQFAADYMSAAGQNTAVKFGGRAARNLIGAR